MLDFLWHSAFGLDETAFSFPHSLLGFGLLLTFWGFISSRINLNHVKQPSVGSMLFFSYFLLGVHPIFYKLTVTPEAMRTIAQIPVLFDDPQAQRGFRLALTYNLTRLHPLFVPASAAAAGIVLAITWDFLQKRVKWMISILFILSVLNTIQDFGMARYFGLEKEKINWAQIPLLATFLIYLLCRRLGMNEWWSWGFAGLLYGIVTASTWPSETGIFAVPMMLLGVYLGKKIWGTIEIPTLKKVIYVAGGCIGLSFVYGMLDLIMRFSL